MDGRLLQFIILGVAGWLNRHQAAQLEYLREENRVLRKSLGKRRPRLDDRQRRRLAVRAREVGRHGLIDLTTIVTPETLMRWYRRLVAQKYDAATSGGAAEHQHEKPSPTS